MSKMQMIDTWLGESMFVIFPLIIILIVILTDR